MTTRITHMRMLPKNVDYWDYYIICRLNSNASKCLQRMEYWDSTKANGNIHAEQINDQLVESGKSPNQDTSRFVYKSREELAWELMGACGERNAYECLDYLANSLQYLKTRHNPYKAFDRTLQYEFQDALVQEHLDRLYAIVKYFCTTLGRQERPVLLAIEQLTSEGIYVNCITKEDGSLDGKGILSIELVAERLRKLHKELHIDEVGCKQKKVKGKKQYKPILPAFIRLDLKKDEEKGFSETSDSPLCKFAQSNTPNLHNRTPQNCTIDSAEMHDPSCKNAQAIPVTTTETTSSTTNTNYDDSANAESQNNTSANIPAPSSQHTHASSSSSQISKMIQHPLHDFIFLDDATTPRVLTVILTCEEFPSETEDDRRGFVAQEIKHDLEKRGHIVSYEWKRDHYQEPAIVVDATSSQSSKEHNDVTSKEQAHNATANEESAQSEKQNKPATEKPAREKTTRTRAPKASKKITPPDEFDLTQEATLENIIALGDAWRGGSLVATERKDSTYQKMLNEGAKLLVNKPRGKEWWCEQKVGYSLKEIDMSIRYYKRMPPDDKHPDLIADDWWDGKNVDLWTQPKNIDKALKALAVLKTPPQAKPAQQNTSSMSPVKRLNGALTNEELRSIPVWS